MNGLTADELRSVIEFYRDLGLKGMIMDAGTKTLDPPLPSPVMRTAPVEDKAAELLDLKDNVIGECTRCKLSKKRTNIVFGEGDPDSEIMFIGEGPGEDEDRQARPFVGRAGQTLRSLIRNMGFTEPAVYIANVVKCRPPENRVPHEDEIDTCIPFLKRQIEIIRPKVIVLLGNVALQSLMENTQLRITAARGRFMEYEGIKVMPTFHPSYLLRNPKDKWLTWEDAVMVLKAIGRDVKAQPGQK